MNEQINVLILDDEKIVRKTLGAILSEENYNVITAQNGEEAVKIAREVSLNIAIIDIKLPDISGIDVLRTLKRIDQDMCVIMVTAFATTITAIKALEAGAYDYINKPVNVTQVKRVIRRGLEKQRLSKENKDLLKDLRNEKRKLEIILQAGDMMSAILNLDELVDFIIEKATEVMEAEKGSLMLLDEESGELKIKGARGLKAEIIENTKIKLGEMIAGKVAQEGQPLLVKDIEKDKRFVGRKVRSHYKSKSFISMPLKKEKKVSGVINLSDKIGRSPVFTESDLRFLSILIQQSATSIENAKLYQEITSLAITDALTGLYNHRYFQERLSEEINRVERYGHPLSLIMLDIDFFKRYNDTFGHVMGDTLLSELATIMKKNVRKIDIVSRYGGEEFIIILPETGIDEAYAVAEKIRKSVEDFNFSIEVLKPVDWKLTISAGVVAFKKGISKTDFIKFADQAMYSAKGEGKNKVYCYKEI